MIESGLDAETIAALAAGSGSSPSAYNTGETVGSDIVSGNTDTSNTLTLGDSATGFINTTRDQDWFKVTLEAGHTYSFVMTGTSNGLDSFLEMHTGTGALIASDDDGAGNMNSNLVFLCTQSGDYFIAAKDFTGDGQSSKGGYTLSMNTAPAPQILDSIDWGTKVASSTVLVYFANASETFGGTTSLGWNAYEKQQAMLALQQYSNVANLTFAETLDSSAATFKLVTTTSTEFLGQFGPPGTSNAGIGYFARNGTGWDEQGGGGLEFGGQGFEVLVHEFGHGLGMAHPHDDGGSSVVMQRVMSEFDSYGLYGLNQGVYTTMSYNDGWELSPSGVSPSPSYGNEAGPMALDIALMQLKYGANTSYHTGDDIYTLSGPGTTGAYVAIWDAGGNDRITYGGALDAVLDLRPATIDYSPTGGGSISYVTGSYSGFTIAQGVVIEQAWAGSGNDIVTGNDAANILMGGAGNDHLTGNGGNDTINGGDGTDLTFYSGYARTYTVQASGGVQSVAGGAEGGTDSVSQTEYLIFKDGSLSFDENTAGAVVMRMYDTAFQRLPDTLGGQFWTHTYESGGITLRDLGISFANSTEFQNAIAGMTNRQIVDFMYENTLDRAPDQQGEDVWTAYLNTHNIGDLFVEFSESAEHKALTSGVVAQGIWDGDQAYQTVEFMYEATFGRRPDAGGAETWANALKGGMSLYNMALAFTSSGEFFNNTHLMNHDQLVDYMYQTALHRAADPVGHTSWVIYLDNGGSVADLVMQFEQSMELQLANASNIDHGIGLGP